tara:strand:+ start:340 stop:507 length:168 start_codon:yes stop_codon:yes gene_type:complete
MTREEKIQRYIYEVVQNMDHKTMLYVLHGFLYEELKNESDEEINQRYNEYFKDND